MEDPLEHPVVGVTCTERRLRDAAFEDAGDRDEAGRRWGVGDRRCVHRRGHPPSTHEQGQPITEVEWRQHVQPLQSALDAVALHDLLVGTEHAGGADATELDRTLVERRSGDQVGHIDRGGGRALSEQGVAGAHLLEPLDLPLAEGDEDRDDAEDDGVGHQRPGVHQRAGRGPIRSLTGWR